MNMITNKDFDNFIVDLKHYMESDRYSKGLPEPLTLEETMKMHNKMWNTVAEFLENEEFSIDFIIMLKMTIFSETFNSNERIASKVGYKYRVTSALKGYVLMRVLKESELPYSFCYLCDYAKKTDYKDYCPCSSYCNCLSDFCLDGEYKKFAIALDSLNIKLATEIAKEIANLPAVGIDMGESIETAGQAVIDGLEDGMNEINSEIVDAVAELPPRDKVIRESSYTVQIR